MVKNNHKIIVRYEQRVVPIRALLLSLSIFIFIALLIKDSLSLTGFLGERPHETDQRIIKFLSVLLLFGVASFVTLTISPNKAVNNAIRAIRINWYFSFFIVFSLLGSIYARFVLGLPTSYFSHAFVACSFFLAFYVFLAVPNKYWSQIRMWIVRAYFLMGAIAAFAVTKNLASRADSNADTAILLGQALALSFYIKSKVFRNLFIGVFGLSLALTFKNTAIIILVCIVLGVYLLPFQYLRKFSISIVLKYSLVASFALILIGSTYFILRSQVSSGVFGYSDGSYSFRGWVLDYQLTQFLKAPLIGRGFTAETSVFYEPHSVIVPTHNDWMDILVQGGLIGFFMFVLGCWRIIKLLLRVRFATFQLNPLSTKLVLWLIWFFTAIFIAISFNPILGKPDTAFIIWITAAFALQFKRELYAKS